MGQFGTIGAAAAANAMIAELTNPTDERDTPGGGGAEGLGPRRLTVRRRFKPVRP